MTTERVYNPSPGSFPGIPGTFFPAIWDLNYTTRTSSLYSLFPITGGGSLTYTVINVKDYGATGNGVTDDTNAIKAAIAASVAGDQIFFPGGTYLVSHTIVLLGYRAYFGAGFENASTIKQANGSNLTSLLCTYNYANNVYFSDNPLMMADLTLNANSANNTSTVGLINLAYGSQFTNLYVTGCASHGIMCTDHTIDNTVIGNTCVENRFNSCKIDNTGGYGFYVNDSASKVTDGRLIDCDISGNTLASIKINSAAGWQVKGNHLYGSLDYALAVDHCFATIVSNNYIEPFGYAPQSAFVGGIAATLNGGSLALICTGNHLSASEISTSTTWQYLAVTGASSVDTSCIIANNRIRGGFVSTTSSTTLSSGAKTVCTPVDMAGIGPGSSLFVVNETMVVDTVTATTFTPLTNWANAHSGTYSIFSSASASHSLGIVLQSNGTQSGSGLPFNALVYGNQVTNVGHTLFKDSYSTLSAVESFGDVQADSHFTAISALIGVPTLSAGSNNGSSAPTPTFSSIGGTDVRGKVNIGSGTGAAAGNQAVVTFAKAYGAIPVAVVVAGNTATEALGVYYTMTATALTIATTTAPTSSQSVGTYVVSYIIVG